MPADIDSLPDEVLAKILAKVPLSVEKIGYQGLSRQWRRVLCSGAAHSLDTWEEDEPLICNPLVPTGAGGALQPPQILQSLVAYKISDTASRGSGQRVWLPQQLQALRLPETNVRVSNLPRLRILETSSLVKNMRTRFRALERFEWRGEELDPGEADVLLSDLGKLENIRYVSISASGMGFKASFGGPPECRISYTTSFNNNEDFTFIPDCLKMHLESYHADFLWAAFEEDYGHEFLQGMSQGMEDSLEMGFRGVRDCCHLKSIQLTYTDSDTVEIFESVEVGVGGFSNLPASCQSVVLPSSVSLGAHDLVGWRCVEHDAESVEFVRA